MPKLTEEQLLEKQIEEAYAADEAEGGTYIPNVCPRTYLKACNLCQKIGVKFNDRWLGERAGDRKDYNKLTGVLYTTKPGTEVGDKSDDKWLYPEKIREYAAKMRAKLYYYCWFVFIDQPMKPCILEFTSSLFSFLRKHTQNNKSEYYGFWDLKNGTNVRVDKGYDEKRGFPTYNAEFERKTSMFPGGKWPKSKIVPLTTDVIIDAKTNGTYPVFPQKEFERGENLIRIIPGMPTPEHWFRALYLHFNIGHSDFLEVLAGEQDPFEEVVAAYKRGAHAEPEDISFEDDEEEVKEDEVVENESKVEETDEDENLVDDGESEENGGEEIEGDKEEKETEGYGCQGDPTMFDEDSKECKKCELLKECKKMVLKKQSKKGKKGKKSTPVTFFEDDANEPDDIPF